jgi:hypothetical protein
MYIYIYARASCALPALPELPRREKSVRAAEPTGLVHYTRRVRVPNIQSLTAADVATGVDDDDDLPHAPPCLHIICAECAGLGKVVAHKLFQYIKYEIKKFVLEIYI